MPEFYALDQLNETDLAYNITDDELVKTHPEYVVSDIVGFLRSDVTTLGWQKREKEHILFMRLLHVYISQTKPSQLRVLCKASILLMFIYSGAFRSIRK